MIKETTCHWCGKGATECIEFINKWYCTVCSQFVGYILESLNTHRGYVIPFSGGSIEQSQWVTLKNFMMANDIRTVIEYGSGLTTELLSCEPYIDKLVTMEDCAEWMHIGSQVRHLHNVDFIKIEKGKDIPDLDRTFDLALVDGPNNYRGYTVEHAMKHATKFIYLHDPHTDDQMDIIKQAVSDGLLELVMVGNEDKRFWKKIGEEG